MLLPLALDPFVEWEHRHVALPAEVQTALVRNAGKAMTLSTTTEPGVTEISINHHVGSIVLPEVHALIRPKIDLQSLFHLLEPSGRSVSLGAQTFGFEHREELLPAFATFVANAIERSTGRGLFRSYRQEEERLLAIRGRIDLRRHLASGLATPIACRYDEFTADVLENQIILAAIRRLLRLTDVSQATRQLLSRQLIRFDEVSAVTIDPDDVLRMRFTRLNRHYEPALRLARLVLQSTSIVDNVGGTQASVFLIDMNKVFEEFLEHRLRRQLAGRLDVTGQHEDHLDYGHLVGIKPDLLFRKGGTAAFVGDAKYKRTWNGKGPESDVHQLLAYATAYDVPEGVLVYSKEGDAPRREIRVKNVAKTVWTWPLDLRGGSEGIDAAIEELAGWILERSGVPTSQPQEQISA
jgi:5-methylcytosine-specific restriction enzyme subunit McrC